MKTKDILEADLAALARKLFGGPDELFAKLPSDQMARLRGAARVAQRHYADAMFAAALAGSSPVGGAVVAGAEWKKVGGAKISKAIEFRSDGDVHIGAEVTLLILPGQEGLFPKGMWRDSVVQSLPVNGTAAPAPPATDPEAAGRDDEITWDRSERPEGLASIDPRDAPDDLEAHLKGLSEIERELRFFVECVRALMRHTNPHLVNEGHAQQWFAVHDAIGNRIEPALDTLAGHLTTRAALSDMRSEGLREALRIAEAGLQTAPSLLSPFARTVVRPALDRVQAILATHPDQPAADDIDRCFACRNPFKPGDTVLEDVNEGTIHASCCGPEIESYVGADGEPLKPGDSIPNGYPWTPQQAADDASKVEDPSHG